MEKPIWKCYVDKAGNVVEADQINKISRDFHEDPYVMLWFPSGETVLHSKRLVEHHEIAEGDIYIKYPDGHAHVMKPTEFRNTYELIERQLGKPGLIKKDRYEVGDVVRLISGGPDMAVHKINLGGAEVYCVWHNAVTGAVFWETFKSNVLALAPTGE